MTSRRALAAALLALPLALTACSSGGGGGDTSPTATPTSASPTQSPTESPSPTDSPTGSPSPTDSPTVTPSPSGSASTVSPSPAVGIEGITVVYSPTTAAKMQQISIVGTTSASLAGKPVYIVKLNDGGPTVISTGSTLNAQGIAKTFAQLGRTGVLELVVPAEQLTGTVDASLGGFPLDPNAKLLARSGQFTVTIG